MATEMGVDDANLVISEAVHMQWRAWRSYLHARIALLRADVRALGGSGDPAAPSFVRDTDTAAQQRTEAEAQIKSLTAAQRTLFDQRVEMKRRAVQEELRAAQRADGQREDRLLIDPDALTRQALDQLLDACEGRGSSHPGMGDTPMPGENIWYQVTIREVNAVTDAQFNLVTKGAAASPLRSTFFVLGGMVALMMIYLLAQYWPAAAPVDTAAAAVVVDTTPMPRWVTKRVTRTAPSGDQTSELVLGTGAGWASAPDQAAMRGDQIYPVALCLPAAQRVGLTALTLHGDGTTSERRYALSTTAPAQPDLLLIACGRDAGSLSYGTLADALPPVDSAVGSAATLADGTQVALLAVATQGQASGQGQIQLLLTVQGLRGSVVGYNPTVQVETGETVATPQRVAEAATSAGAETQQISYALSAADQPRTAIWAITDPGTGQVYRWRITIVPPLSADTLLAQAIQIDTVQAQRTSLEQITITLTLVNQSDAPLAVAASDLRLTRGGEALPTPVFAAVTLVPGTPRTVMLAVPLSTGQEIVIHLAGQSFQIRDEQKRG